MSSEMQWQVDERTIRDCPGDRTEVEWRAAVSRLEKELTGTSRCTTCGQPLHAVEKYQITETESWLPSHARLPRGRWGLSAMTYTLTAAKKLRKFMGPRATIYVLDIRRGDGSSSYRRL